MLIARSTSHPPSAKVTQHLFIYKLIAISIEHVQSHCKAYIREGFLTFVAKTTI